MDRHTSDLPSLLHQVAIVTAFDCAKVTDQLGDGAGINCVGLDGSVEKHTL